MAKLVLKQSVKAPFESLISHLLQSMQSLVDYRGLAVTERRNIQASHPGIYRMSGMCYSDGTLYTVEEVPSEYCLAAYQVHRDSGNITLVDTMPVYTTKRFDLPIHPRVDHRSQRVFIPCKSGVTVARLNGDRLVEEMTLTSVRHAVSVDIMSPDTVYVCDTRDISAVDVTRDRVMWTLEQPDTVIHHHPNSLAVLGGRVMVGFMLGPLVMYAHHSRVPGRDIIPSLRLDWPYTISTDRKQHFLIADSSNVFVVDIDGTLRHRIPIGMDMDIADCAVVNKQLWVGCKSGYIEIMSTK